MARLRRCTHALVVALVFLYPLACHVLSELAGGSRRLVYKPWRAKDHASSDVQLDRSLPAYAFVSGQRSWWQRAPSTILTHMLSGTRKSQCTPRLSLKSSVNPNQIVDGIKLANSHRAEWKLKEAVEELGCVISSIPIDTLSNTRSTIGAYLKYAKMMRADWNLLMGNNDECFADYRDVLVHLPSDSDARVQLAHALHDAKGDTEQALGFMDEVIQLGPQAGTSLDSVAYCCAAQDAGVFAASLGRHDEAQKYFELFRKFLCDCKPRGYKYVQIYQKSSEQMKRYSQGVFYEMVNALCKGEAERAAAAATFHKAMILGDHPELTWRREVFASSWEFIASTPVGKAPEPSLFYSTYQMLQLAMGAASLDSGLILELGVWHGASLRLLASRWPDDQVHGFDTFTGLPEEWGSPEKGGEPTGAYSTFGAMPSDLPQNVQLHAGIFSDTLPGFMDTHPGPIRFMNVDCDLYSSTKDIFDQASGRIVPGTIIVFDEYVMTPTWQDDEFKAFQEAVAKHGWTFEYLAVSIMTGQAVVRIT